MADRDSSSCFPFALCKCTEEFYGGDEECPGRKRGHCNAYASGAWRKNQAESKKSSGGGACDSYSPDGKVRRTSFRIRRSHFQTCQQKQTIEKTSGTTF